MDDALEDHKYKVFLIKKEGLFDWNYNDVREYFRYSNFIAIRSASLQVVEKLRRGVVIPTR